MCMTRHRTLRRQLRIAEQIFVWTKRETIIFISPPPHRQTVAHGRVAAYVHDTSSDVEKSGADAYAYKEKPIGRLESWTAGLPKTFPARGWGARISAYVPQRLGRSGTNRDGGREWATALIPERRRLGSGVFFLGPDRRTATRGDCGQTAVLCGARAASETRTVSVPLITAVVRQRRNPAERSRTRVLDA